MMLLKFIRSSLSLNRLTSQTLTKTDGQLMHALRFSESLNSAPEMHPFICYMLFVGPWVVQSVKAKCTQFDTRYNR